MAEPTKIAQSNESSEVVKPDPIKKPYSGPMLTEYGSVAKLTQGGQGTGTDGGIVEGMMMQCL